MGEKETKELEKEKKMLTMRTEQQTAKLQEEQQNCKKRTEQQTAKLCKTEKKRKTNSKDNHKDSNDTGLPGARARQPFHSEGELHSEGTKKSQGLLSFNDT